MKKGWFVFLMIITAASFAAQAQQLKVAVTGGFLSDSLKIGEETRFYVTARYPSELNILFPDSTFNFTPFEYVKKQYFPTRTSGGYSFDSAVYYLTTFEVDREQRLSLPAFVVHTSDCTTFQSDPDTILITQLVTTPPDTVAAERLPLKETTAYHNVFFEFNYPLYMIIGGVVLILAIIAALVFGKRIVRYFRIKRLQKNHSKFQETYSSIVRNVQSAFSVPVTESALVVWKKYMEQIDNKPYTRLTTRELIAMSKDEALGKNLGTIDRALYGHDTSVIESLENLKGIADQRFQKKIEEVRYGA
jgi:hypothetical protein